METKLLHEIYKILNNFPEYWEKDKLLKNKVIEDIRSYNETIIEALLSNEMVQETYSLKLSTGIVFKTENFIDMLRYKNYWDNSYTKYTNEVGLTSENKYLKYSTDVILDFPHKDSVLEGGMTKEDVGKKEIYYHNVIAKEEIDTLLAPKILNNVQKFDVNGLRPVNSFNSEDNLIIKGNNLIALSSLRQNYQEKVKLIYIDPPYNTGGDSFKYNDQFNHSTWLTFMKNRLQTAKQLLSKDGSIFVQVDDNEDSYLKVLMDEIFGKANFRNKITWKRRGGSANPSNRLNNVVEYILWYAKDAQEMCYSPVFSLDDDNTQQYIKERFINEHKGKKYMLAPIERNKKLGIRETLKYEYKGYIPKYGWMVSEENLRALDESDRIHWNSKNKPNRRVFLEDYKGQPVGSLWNDIKVINPMSKERTEFESGQKPEALIKRIIEMVTEENDIVLDFHMGSGTTPVVAHKMNRRYIGIEQMDYIENFCINRLRNTIAGEQGGISKSVGWKGGGSFVYAELYSLNEEFLHEIQACQNTHELETVIEKMKEKAYLNFKVQLEKVSAKNMNFQELSLIEQKDILFQVLDMNQLYLNYSEMDDSQYCISDSVKAFNHFFYQDEGVTNE